MFIFIDTTQLKKEMKRMVGLCPNCHKQKELVLIRIYQCLRIFFIPVWHWGNRYYVMDEACGSAYQISEEDAVLVKYDKKDINDCHLETAYQTAARCPACGKPVESHFDFCPYCGSKRKQD